MRYFEDFAVGERHDLGSYPMTEVEVLAYARRYDPQPFHVDAEAAKRSIFGGLIASGWHTCAAMMRMTVEVNRKLEAAALGSPGIESCRWLRPVRAGDTLGGAMEVLEVWPSRSRPVGFVRRRIELTNQRGEVVLRVVGITMYQRRAAASGAEAAAS